MKKIISLLLLAALLLAGCSQAKEPEVVNTISTDRMTYYELSDGTWQADGRIYKYRLEIPGQLPNSIEESTFVYLSNIEKITFDKAWKAAGFSNSTSDYFPAEDAILVDWHGVKDSAASQINCSAVDTNNNWVVKPDSSLDAAISHAILDTYNDVIPNGMLNTEGHIVFTSKIVNGAVDEQTSCNQEAVAVYYLILQYCENDGELEEQNRLWGEAVIVFMVDESGNYSVKDFLRPQYSADYDEDLLKLLTTASATTKEQYEKQLLDKCQKTAKEHIENREASATAQPG